VEALRPELDISKVELARVRLRVRLS